MFSSLWFEREPRGRLVLERAEVLGLKGKLEEGAVAKRVVRESESCFERPQWERARDRQRGREDQLWVFLDREIAVDDRAPLKEILLFYFYQSLVWLVNQNINIGEESYFFILLGAFHPWGYAKPFSIKGYKHELIESWG